MFTRFRKNIPAGFRLYLVGFLVILLLALSAGQELLHNHEADLEDHHDCPAHQLALLFSSTIIVYFVFSVLLSLCEFLFFPQFQISYSCFNCVFHSRAPPFQF